MKILLIKLIKSQIVKKYNNRSKFVVIHIIYSFMIIQNHMKSLASLIIIQLINHLIILRRSWIRKHEIIYDNHDDNLIFFSKHCSYLKALDHSFSKILSDMKSKFIEKVISAKFLSKAILRQNNQQTSWKSENSQSTTKRKRNSAAKDELIKIEYLLKKEQIANKSWRNSFINIVTIEATSFNTLSQQKDVQIFVVFIKNIDIELNKKKSIIDSKTIVSTKYHDFLNVFLFKEKSWWTFFTSKVWSQNWADGWKRSFHSSLTISYVEKRTFTSEKLFEEAFKKRFHSNQFSFICLIHFIREKIEWRTSFLRWLSKVE